MRNLTKVFASRTNRAYIAVLSISVLFLNFDSLAQDKKQIEVKQAELSGLKNEIKQLETEIKQKTKKEKESYAVMENYSRQNFLLNKVINNLRAEEKQKEEEIVSRRNEISWLESEIKLLKENYARYVVAIYKNGRANELASLFDSHSVEQALLRYKYLQKFSASRKKDLTELKLNKEKLISARIQLEKEKEEKEQLAAQKVTEENQLELKLNETKKILTGIRKDKASLKKDLETKRGAELKIKNLITKLIEEAERKRKEEELRLARLEKEKLEKSKKTGVEKTKSKTVTKTVPVEDYNLDLSTAGFSSFLALKGKLNWPVTGGKVFRKYGENKNSTLNTVTLNYGVDILAKSDLNVKSVAEGVISAIDWIPGYGSVIIITHKGDYRTVYSHLSQIFVKEGDHVKMGSLIAQVGESLDGNILHFEIWNSRNNQNPEVWLARK